MSKNVNETNALLVDAGQSSVRFRYIQGAHETEWDLEKIDTAKSVPEQLIQRLHHFFEEAQDTPDVVAISSTGISDQSAASKLIFDYVSAHGGRKVMLAHDSIGGYLSCLNTDLGAMSAVGTGVNPGLRSLWFFSSGRLGEPNWGCWFRFLDWSASA